MRTPPKLIALDIDGTLVNEAGTVSDAVMRAVSAAARRSHIVLATGRTAMGVAAVLDLLGLPDLTTVCSNGSVIRYPGGELTVRTAFDPAPVVELLNEKVPGAVFAVEHPGVGNMYTSSFTQDELAGDLRQVSLAELIAAKVPRMIAKWPERTWQEINLAMASVTLPGTVATMDYGTNAWLTCVPTDTSKAAALEELRATLGVSNRDTAAIGDGTNDVEMLSWAARGVAMGQAPDIVKAAAGAVTADIDSDGAAHALRKWFE
ncbi:MAG: HAD family hydrolase [Sciscionella sp.]